MLGAASRRGRAPFLLLSARGITAARLERFATPGSGSNHRWCQQGRGRRVGPSAMAGGAGAPHPPPVPPAAKKAYSRLLSSTGKLQKASWGLPELKK